MAARRRNGAFVSAAVTEAARRQLMAPVPCWELQWCTPECVGQASKLKVYKWIRTDKVQQFSDDEDEADDILAPLPDEPDNADGDEEEQEEEAPKTESQIQSRDVSEPRIPPTELPTAPSSPKPHPLSVSLIPEPDDADNVAQDDAEPTLTLNPLVGPTDPELDALGPNMDSDSLDVLGMEVMTEHPAPSFEVQDPMNVAEGEDIMAGIIEDSLPTYHGSN